MIWKLRLLPLVVEQKLGRRKGRGAFFKMLSLGGTGILPETREAFIAIQAFGFQNALVLAQSGWKPD